MLTKPPAVYNLARTIAFNLAVVLLISCEPDADDSSNAIHDLLAVSGDTLIAVKWHTGLIITTDGGKTWNDLAESTYLKKITIDKSGVLWGLNSWIGIHEAS